MKDYVILSLIEIMHIHGNFFAELNEKDNSLRGSKLS